MGIRLRQVTSEDDVFLLELYADTRSHELDAWGWDEAQREPFINMQFNAQRQSYQLQYPDADHRIIMREKSTDRGEAVPLGRLLTRRTHHEIRLIDISLLSQHRNKGIGSEIIRDLLCEAHNIRIPLRLSVLRMNPASRLYDRLGFVVTNEDDMYYEMEANHA